jgi:integrase
MHKGTADPDDNASRIWSGIVEANRAREMAIRRRETSDGPRFDVEWRLPDRTKRRKTFRSERQARIFEASIVTKSAAGEVVDPHAGRVTLATVFRPWFASRQDLSPKVRRGYEDIWRLRIEPRFGGWHVTKIDHQSIQAWVNEMSASGLSPRTVRWVHSVLKMTLDFAIDEGQLLSRNPAARTKFPPARQTAHTYLTTTEVAALAAQRLLPILSDRIAGRPPGAPAITSPNGALLGLENWKRSTQWRTAIVEIERPTMRLHDLRHTYASLARRAGADLRLLQKTMGHASITVTAHVYADLYDDELDVVASALDALDDRPSE